MNTTPPTPTLSPDQFDIYGIGSSAVFGQWGYFTDRIGAGTCWVITYNREHGRDKGRGVSSEPRCMAIRPDLYTMLAASEPNSVPVEDIGCYEARQRISRLSIGILQGSREGSPIHYRIMRKKQAAATRTRVIKGVPTVQHLPAVAGVPVAVLVGLRWFADRSGYDINQIAALHPSENLKNPAAAART